MYKLDEQKMISKFGLDDILSCSHEDLRVVKMQGKLYILNNIIKFQDKLNMYQIHNNENPNFVIFHNADRLELGRSITCFLCYKKGSLFKSIKEAQNKLSHIPCPFQVKPVIKEIKSIKRKKLNLNIGYLFSGPPGNGKTLAMSYIRHRLSSNTINKKALYSPDDNPFVKYRTNLGDDINPEEFNSNVLSKIDGTDKQGWQVSIFSTHEDFSPKNNPAAFRKGRIDKIIRFDPPTKQQTRDMLEEGGIGKYFESVYFDGVSYADIAFVINQKKLDENYIPSKDDLIYTCPKKIGFANA